MVQLQEATFVGLVDELRMSWTFNYRTHNQVTQQNVNVLKKIVTVSQRMNYKTY